MNQKTETDEQPAPNACTPNFDVNDPNQKEVGRILKTFKYDIMGVISLGTDGILRSLTADRDVISAEALTPALIESFLLRMPPEFRGGFESVDGSQTPKEKWFKPDEGILPAPLPKERRHMDEERKVLMRKRLEDDSSLVDMDGILDSTSTEEQ